MEILEVYKTKDGQFFEDSRKALAHCENKFGEELDGLFKTTPRIGHMERLEIMRTIIAKPEEFKALAAWVFEYHETKKHI